MLVEAIDKARTVQGQVEVGSGTVETVSCIVHNALNLLYVIISLRYCSGNG